MKWSTACPDWEKRVIAGDSMVPFPPLFPTEAQEALDIFNQLILVDTHGKPTLGEASRPWVTDFVSAIFGAYDKDSGRRLIREFFLLVSKKNGKSTVASAIMLTLLVLNWRQSAELIILAPTVEIANNSFFPARDMVGADGELGDLMHVQEHYRQITHRGTGATLKVIAAENESVGGKKGSFILVDEMWLFGKRSGAENMFREATGGLASRTEGCVIWLSTQSDEPPAGVFAQKLEYARGVRDGKIDDPQFMPAIYEFPKSYIDDNKHLDPKNFYVTNPNLGASVDEEFILREFKKAQNDGKASMQGFLAKHLNVQIGVSLKNQCWAGAEFWEAAAGAVTLESIFELCEVLEIGVDGGGLDDLLGLAVVGRVTGSQQWLLWTRAWCHPVALKRRKQQADNYRNFEKDGDLIIVSEIGQDVRQVGDIIMRCEDSGLLDRIGVDQHGIGSIIDEAEFRGIEHDRIVGVPQGWRLSGAIKTLERRVAEKTITHDGQALMSWCVGAAMGEVRGNNVYITKQASGSGKIDPLVAAFCAVALMAMNPEAKNSRSIYDGLTAEEIKERMGP